MPHTHINGRVQSHQTRRGMCPTSELCNVVVVHGLVNYSSNEKKIANNPRHAFGGDDEDFLQFLQISKMSYRIEKNRS